MASSWAFRDSSSGQVHGQSQVRLISKDLRRSTGYATRLNTTGQPDCGWPGWPDSNMVLQGSSYAEQLTIQLISVTYCNRVPSLTFNLLSKDTTWHPKCPVKRSSLQLSTSYFRPATDNLLTHAFLCCFSFPGLGYQRDILHVSIIQQNKGYNHVET